MRTEEENAVLDGAHELIDGVSWTKKTDPQDPRFLLIRVRIPSGGPVRSSDCTGATGVAALLAFCGSFRESYQEGVERPDDGVRRDRAAPRMMRTEDENAVLAVAETLRVSYESPTILPESERQVMLETAQQLKAWVLTGCSDEALIAMTLATRRNAR